MEIDPIASAEVLREATCCPTCGQPDIVGQLSRSCGLLARTCGLLARTCGLLARNCCQPGEDPVDTWQAADGTLRNTAPFRQVRDL
ncbi:MAG: hypothetical protein J2P28_19245 [Actinobacteria bacterium]|nr:hypothetical protein [Actinomycetota bacterium]